MAAEWKKTCKPWLTKEGALYERTDVAPPPSKDFLQVFVTCDEVIFRIWRIIPPTRADSNQHPVEMRCKYAEFHEDDRMRAEIGRSMGEREVDYLDRLLGGHIDYLVRLPRKLCSTDALWSKIYMEHTTQPITHELLMLTDQKGWKEVFFMNKLQLQMLLRRTTEKDKHEKRFRFGDKFGDKTKKAGPSHH